jgi:hypothetical protein
MRRPLHRVSIVCVLASAFAFACGWNPSVTAVPITAPWDSMNLPVKENARVWASTATELKVAHKDDKPTVLAAYQKALTANGWKSSGVRDTRTVVFEKDGKRMDLEIYDFENTGVILTLK